MFVFGLVVAREPSRAWMYSSLLFRSCLFVDARASVWPWSADWGAGWRRGPTWSGSTSDVFLSTRNNSDFTQIPSAWIVEVDSRVHPRIINRTPSSLSAPASRASSPTRAVIEVVFIVDAKRLVLIAIDDLRNAVASREQQCL
ncbi:hypothetical protein BCR34DRAFT_240007 [Clohesyomyces aquaticus]|uniref:Uncharacterized protein n=1 Tax=Clohesyomyces aquaticus TaxID=1231657 RepID=A0A1Y1Y5L1_9PLEO|nr:hypothetical protein BCR34DRAFT_240007 [Clohesyomyces aquaticus]